MALFLCIHLAFTQTVTTLAGSSKQEGNKDGMGRAARFHVPRGMAVDRAGNIYVADAINGTIRKITPTGLVTTLAGGGPPGGSGDGMGRKARFCYPAFVAADRNGNVYVSGDKNATIYQIRKITPNGVVTTLPAQRCGNTGVAVDEGGNIYVGYKAYGAAIRKITPNGAVTTLAGNMEHCGYVDGPGITARFSSITGIAVDTGGNLYVGDGNGIRKVTSDGVVSTLAGIPDQDGSALDGTGIAARFWHPVGVAVDRNGNVIVADSGNNTIRKITPTGVVTTIAGSPRIQGSSNGNGLNAQFDFPFGVAVDGNGTIYVAEEFNQTIRKISLVVSNSIGIGDQIINSNDR